MLQLAGIIIFTFSVFVGRVCPVPQEEGHNSTTIKVATNAKNASDILSGSDTRVVNVIYGNEPNTETVKLNETMSGSLSKYPPAESDAKLFAMETKHEKKHICNSTKEQVDMLNCYVKPTDDDADDDEITEKASPLNSTVSTVPTNASLGNNTGSSPGKVDNEIVNENNVAYVTETIVVPLQNNTSYDFVSENTNHSTNASIDGTNAESNNKENKTVISSVAPLLADKVRNKDSGNINEAEKSTDESKDKSMPSGIIALVVTISFAVAVVTAYVSTIAWRRYVEYRYGHQELLVNELEFDTNDLRHFEL